MKSQAELRREVNERKSIPCMDCIADGKDGIWPLECMQFDHVPGRGAKLGTIREFLRDEEKLLIELDKCDVVCANHHAIRTKARPQSAEGIAKISGDNHYTKKSPEKALHIRMALARPEVKANMSGDKNVAKTRQNREARMHQQNCSICKTPGHKKSRCPQRTS